MKNRKPARAKTPKASRRRTSRSASNLKLSDVQAAFRDIPPRGVIARLKGNFNLAGFNTHIQGVLSLTGHYVLSYSDEDCDRGLLLPFAAGQLVQPVRVPNSSAEKLYHAGGIQSVGDVVAVPSESGDSSSTVEFLDGKDLTKGKATPVAATITRNKDAMAVGITDVIFSGKTKWIAAVFQKGCVDFYLHDALLDPKVAWQRPVRLKVKQRHHQAFVLLAEAAKEAGADDALYAVGLNHGNWFYSHRATLYRITLTDGQPSAIDKVDSREDFDFDAGATLRYGGGMVTVGSDLQLYGTERVFQNKCVVQRFGPGTSRSRAPKARSNDAGRSVEQAPGVFRVALPASTPDLKDGVIIVLSGGPYDFTNPPEVLKRMDRVIADVNSDPWVQEQTNGAGLRFKLLTGQAHAHLHQRRWRDIRDKLRTLKAQPLIVVGHSNGGAAAASLAKTLAEDGKDIDLLVTADSVATLDDLGDINEIPSNVRFNLNSYVIPTLEWLLVPFPIGRRNKALGEGPSDALVNVGLAYRLPGALAHRNAFYDLAGGDLISGSFAYPEIFQDVILTILRKTSPRAIIDGIRSALQELSDLADVAMKFESRPKTLAIEPRPGKSIGQV
jgi:pimeloyl-ACP methyl ester carboxylesterase